LRKEAALLEGCGKSLVWKRWFFRTLLDNSNALAFDYLSFCYLLQRQYDRTVSAAERAIALEPNAAIAYSSLAWALAYSPQPAQALLAAHKAERLDPLMGYLSAYAAGLAYASMGQCDKAIPALKRYVAYFNQIGGHLMLTACYVELGLDTEAHAQVAEVLRINPQFSLAAQKQMSPLKGPLRERIYGDVAKAGLK
jgi:adenylate cyclase